MPDFIGKSLKGLTLAGIGALVLLSIIKIFTPSSVLPGLTALESTIVYIGILTVAFIFCFVCAILWFILEIKEQHVAREASKEKPKGSKVVTSLPTPIDKPKALGHSLAAPAFAILVTVAFGLGSLFYWIGFKSETLVTAQNSHPISVCIGEYQSNCSGGSIWSPCGTNLQNFAEKQCGGKTAVVKVISDVGGNKCGYLSADVYCN